MMIMPTDSVARSESGRIITLLGAQDSGKTDVLLALAGLITWPTLDARLTALVGSSNSVSFCSAQRLFPGRLTVGETIQLMAALHSLDRPAYCEYLFPASALTASADQSTYTLPRQLSRLLNLVLALLPDPHVLLIDDVTRDLSLPAQRQLCRFILEEQQRQPRMILFATRDLRIAQVLGGEVWLFDRGQILQQWRSTELPAVFFQAAVYELDLKNPAAARSLHTTLAAQSQYARDIQLVSAATVQVIVDQAGNLLNVMQIAGRNLLNFRVRPLEADYLLAQWPAIATRDTMGLEPFKCISHTRLRTTAWRQRWRGLWHLALGEWRAHFRPVQRKMNILFSGLLVLIVMAFLLQKFELDQLTVWSPFILLLSSSMILGFVGESLHRLTQVADSETLFQSARPPRAASRLSLLALYDQTAIGRTGILLGFAAGQFCVLLEHSLIPLVVWGITLAYAGQEWPLLITGVTYWLLTAVNSLALAMWAGCLARRPRWTVVLGWLLWLLVSISGMVAWIDQPLTWLWPHIGLTVAIQQLPTAPTVALVAFGLALLGMLTLCALALRSFKRYSAIYWEL